MGRGSDKNQTIFSDVLFKFESFLSLLQISRLEQTWVTLRQRHTEGAILYEKKLKPFMKNMNDGKGETPV